MDGGAAPDFDRCLQYHCAVQLPQNLRKPSLCFPRPTSVFLASIRNVWLVVPKLPVPALTTLSEIIFRDNFFPKDPRRSCIYRSMNDDLLFVSTIFSSTLPETTSWASTIWYLTSRPPRRIRHQGHTLLFLKTVFPESNKVTSS